MLFSLKCFDENMFSLICYCSIKSREINRGCLHIPKFMKRPYNISIKV